MDTTEQIIIYDTMTAIKEQADVLVPLLQERGTPEQVAAYRSAIYSSVVRLGSLFTQEQRMAHEERHRKIKEDLDAFMSRKQVD